MCLSAIRQRMYIMYTYSPPRDWKRSRERHMYSTSSRGQSALLFFTRGTREAGEAEELLRSLEALLR